jgi:adenylate kinase family enzyme
MRELFDIAEAVSSLRSANRVLVIGCSGGGKTRLSMRLCKLLDLPMVSMDREFFWMPGWRQRARQEERALIAQAIAGERWLMDGSGPSSFDLRVPRADVVLWLRMPRLLCLWGVTSRWIRWVGRTRPEMAPDCPERIDWHFLRYVWHFERRLAPLIVAGLARHGPQVPVFQLKSRREMRQLLDLLDTPA